MTGNPIRLLTNYRLTYTRTG